MRVDDAHRRQVERLVARHVPGARGWYFGSRVSGRPARYADLDLALERDPPIAESELGALREALDASDVPFVVDVCRWADLPAAFVAGIGARREPLGAGTG